MTGQNNNKRKNRLIMFMLIAIIAVLFVGVIYQFIVIKKLEKQVENSNSAYFYVLEKKQQTKIF